MMAELISRWRVVFGVDADKRDLRHRCIEADRLAQTGRQTFHAVLDEIPGHRRTPRPPPLNLEDRLTEEDRLVREALG